MLRTFIITIILFFHETNICLSQYLVSELDASVGYLIKHSPLLLLPPSQATYGLHLRFKKQTEADAYWKIAYKLPEVGVGFSFFQMGNTAIYGNVIGVYPTFTRYFFRRPKHAMHITYASGISYNSAPFDALANPLNVAIGSRLNNITSIRISSQFVVKKQLLGQVAFSIFHTSNGSLQLPNLGYNIASLHVGLRFAPPHKINNQFNINDVLPYNSGVRYFFRASIATNERQAVGGPKYPIYIATLGVSKQITLKNKWFTGVDFEYNSGIHDQLIFNANTYSNLQLAAVRSSLIVGHEFMVNRFGLPLQLGYYVYKKAFKPMPLYFKIGAFRYYKLSKKNRTQLLAGIMMKSHFGTAEFIEATLGLQY